MCYLVAGVCSVNGACVVDTVLTANYNVSDKLVAITRGSCYINNVNTKYDNSLCALGTTVKDS